MTTYIAGNRLVLPDGTSQTTRATAPPYGATNRLGIWRLASTAQAQNRNNSTELLRTYDWKRGGVGGVGGFGCNVTDLTGARAPGVTYVNTTGRAMFITVTVNASGGGVNGTGFAYAGFNVNGVGLTTAGGYQGSWGCSTTNACVVPPGASYTINASYSGSGSIRIYSLQLQ